MEPTGRWVCKWAALRLVCRVRGSSEQTGENMTAATEGVWFVRVNMEKIVDAWTPEGAAGKLRTIFCDAKLLSATKETIQAVVKKWVEGYGLDWDQFKHWPDEDGRFTHSRIEDGKGEPDESVTGTYLADYDLRIELFRSVPRFVGTLDRMSINEDSDDNKHKKEGDMTNAGR